MARAVRQGASDSALSMDLILDVDFDYCVYPTRTHGIARSSEHVFDGSVWLTAVETAEWLQHRGLLRPETFAGVVESHEQVLPIWSRLVETGRLRVPFGILHVDAHPDMMDLEPTLAQRLDERTCLDATVMEQARPGNFLQFVVRAGWVDRIWMLFPDHERDRIAAIARASIDEAAAIFSKPVESKMATVDGGMDVVVRIGRTLLSVGLHTRASLPPLPSPGVTVLAHSPEFVPSHADAEFLSLARYLGAAA